MDQCPLNVGLMPNPENSCTDLEEIFVNHIFNTKGLCRTKRWRMIAAINGAHTLGSAKVENSGYKGFWSDPVNSGVFNNDYMRNIVAHGWGPDRAVNGNPKKNQWKLIDRSSDHDKSE